MRRIGIVVGVLVRLDGRGGLSRGADVLDGPAHGVGNESGQPPGDRAPIEARPPCDLLSMGGRYVGGYAANVGTGGHGLMVTQGDTPTPLCNCLAAVEGQGFGG